MQVRFTCPACQQAHMADMPETTIHLTCSRTGKALQLRVTAGGDVKAVIVGQSDDQNEDSAEE